MIHGLNETSLILCCRGYFTKRKLVLFIFELLWSFRPPNFGPGRTGQIVVYFTKKSVTSSVRQVRPVMFWSTEFCQALPNFKGAIVLPRSRTIFCQAWNLTDLSIYTPWFEGKRQSRKFDLAFLIVRVFSGRSPPKYLMFTRQSNGEDGRFVPRGAARRSLLRIQLLWFPRLNLYIPVQTDQIRNPYANRRYMYELRGWWCSISMWLTLRLTNILLFYSAPKIDKFCRDFW